MGSIRKYAAVNTKIKYLSSKLLKKEDYKKLLEITSYDDAFNYLKNTTDYGDLIEKDEILEIEELERLFNRHLYQSLEKINHYFVNEDREFIKALFVRYEVENIKLLLRLISRNEELKDFKNKIYIPKIKTNVDYELLESSSTLEEAILNLANTPYKRVLEQYIGDHSSRQMFYIEMTLDRHYFNNLMRVTQKLDKEDKKLVNELLGRNIDLLNIQWIYRGSKYYGLSPEELINYTLNGGFLLKYEFLKDLCYTSSFESFREKINKSGYSKDLVNSFGESDEHIESEIEKYLFNLFLKFKKNSYMNMVEFLVYIHSLEFEMRDLFIILESKRYGISEDVAKTFLVRPV
ncbi:V-type ATPase subunit [Helicovermis profundi]|uniref:Uncharacterized protein n=1 Tax=Helicovermis profundi TaxID=3065157 RepID=A0AAU9E6B3_9FIRM|nr:hypothetical protein HLPR_26020 [Clostridia bacterium S502]